MKKTFNKQFYVGQLARSLITGNNFFPQIKPSRGFTIRSGLLKKCFTIPLLISRLNFSCKVLTYNLRRKKRLKKK
jgi:hypothetical protein